MDIDLLSKMVKELILDNDRVVLPGLGAFVAETVPSTFSDKGYTINPPYRRLFFRSKPDEGRELAELYAKGNNVDPAVADRIISDFVAELKSILYSKKAVAFPGLGRLRATKENNIFFIADEDLDIYPAGFGLEPISLKTHQETREEVAAAVEDLKSLLTEPETVYETVSEPEITKPETFTTPESEVVPEPEPETISEPETTVTDPESMKDPATEDSASARHSDLPHARHSGLDPESLPRESEPLSSRKPFNVKKTLLITFGIILAVALLLLAALAIVGRTSPEWIDQYLYTPEELKILNHIL